MTTTDLAPCCTRGPAFRRAAATAAAAPSTAADNLLRRARKQDPAGKKITLDSKSVISCIPKLQRQVQEKNRHSPKKEPHKHCPVRYRYTPYTMAVINTPETNPNKKYAIFSEATVASVMIKVLSSYGTACLVSQKKKPPATYCKRS